MLLPWLSLIHILLSCIDARTHPNDELINRADTCAAMSSLQLENTTILGVEHVSGPTNVSTAGSCQSSALVSSSLCRVFFVINTTSTSAVHAEAWLPDTWFGRFLGLGNGGLDGCKCT